MTTESTRRREPADGAQRPPFHRRVLKLEHPANVGPLVHVGLWVAFLAVGLFAPGATAWYVAVPLIVLLALLNLSITVGVLHMHTHRPLFVSRAMNRLTDMLCCLPGGYTGALMREVHVLNHHRFNDGPGDVTSTDGRERGLRAVWYWMSYSAIIQIFTLRKIFATGPSTDRRRRRHRYLVDAALYVVVVGTLAYFAGTTRFLMFYVLPFAVTQLNSGYFAWLTHAPARVFDDDPSKSINTVGNWLNFWIFNQGYHSVHHRYPGIHWSQIPDRLDFMRQVDPGVVVPYWMTLNSAWRVLVPGGFLDTTYGERWKTKLENRLADGSARARYLPWFAWV